ncbi:uncharacterized protein LOC143153590 [Ptiloglossa arizonensis]|uniref:uncharacterized protein LOC143153590 n=1 Tax=Ptiloglossa arizonensis TaxID=3350558 RepID=UPI003F9EE8E5
MPRLVKIDKKGIPKSVSTHQDDQIVSNVDVRRCKPRQHSKCEKTRLHTDVTQTRIPGWRLNKSTESALRKPKRPTRTTATHNFLYEFDSFGNSKSPNNTTPTRLRSSSNIGQGDSPMKSLNAKQNSNTGQTYPIAALPKLRSYSESASNKLDKQNHAINYNKNNNLPNIRKRVARGDRGLIMDRDEKGTRNATSEIDREVEKVKFDWQAFRADAAWKRDKNLIPGTRTKKLYDTLDKMSREIERIQKSYLDPKSNQYLQRSATKELNDSQSSYDDKVDKIRDVLFRKENLREKFVEKKKIDQVSSNVTSIASKSVPAKSIRANKQSKTKSLLCNTRTQNTKNALKLDGDLSLSLKKGNLTEVSLESEFGNGRENAKRGMRDTEKNFTSNEDLEPKVLFPSSKNLAEMIKKLNVQSFDMYDIGNDCNDYEEDLSRESLENDRNMGIKHFTNIKNISVENCTQTIMDEKTESTKAMKEPYTRDVVLKRDDRLAQDNNVLCFDNSIQTKVAPALKNDAFVKMEQHALNNVSLPRNALLLALQSEYLKKDASLKLM